MTDVLFSALDLSEQLEHALTAMGFETATPIQAQTIPLIRTGVDIIARSQTGTGKTAAFSVPVLERIDTKEDKPSVQALILCPTRELAQQAGEEIRKLAKFMPGIRPVEVYGGTNMERQFIQLRRANLVIGTPGRVMDHMRRKTLKLDQLKMIVLDEADEMLNMGFKEDIETILQDTPENRQTILFSATMPPSILALVGQFLHDPATVEIDKGLVTIQRIEQTFVDVPSVRKADALVLLLRYHRPNRGLVFCNTKRMVDELTHKLNTAGFSAESIHGDLSQSQRTSVMNGFKSGKVAVLIATDVAARGIDVQDLDFVFNFDIPMTTEYYVHRIGRTGRAGKGGCAITICSGKRQINTMNTIARSVKSEIRHVALPTPADIQVRELERNLLTVEGLLTQTPEEYYVQMVQALLEKGHDAQQIAAAALQLHFPVSKVIGEPIPTTKIGPEKRSGERKPLDKADRPEGRTSRSKSRKADDALSYTDLCFDIGTANRVSANHLVGAITELSGISGKDIGKIQVYQDQSIVGIPSDMADIVLAAMRSCKICGKPTHVSPMVDFPKKRSVRSPGSKAAHYAADRVAKYKTASSAEPARRKKKIAE